jgi:hypothetical protein
MGLLDNQTQQDYYDGNDFGGYQFTSLEDIINNFIIAYVGENKIIPKVKRTDIAFHAQRAVQELSFDTFKSIKSQEITLPPSNTMVLPQDYVNYTKVCWVDGNGIERPLYPTKHTSNPTPILQNTDGGYTLTAIGDLDDASANIVLDGEYGNIQVGTIVSGPYIPIDNGTDPITCVVVATSNASSITTITIGYFTNATPSVQTTIFPTQTNTNTILSFTNADGSLILEEETFVIVENLDWTDDDFKITANAAADITDVKVGMLVSHDLFPIGTTVTNVDDVTIVVSNLPDDEVLTNLGEVTFISTPGNSTTWNSYSSDTSSSTSDANAYNHDTDIYDFNLGQRYGLEPSHSQANGTYYIDNLKGLIHFSSNISGKNVILKYISDGLGTDGEMVVHKFAEEAMYKSIAYAVLSTSISGQALVPRFKKEKFAATRQAKLRLSNLKIEELTQIMRGKSKWIKS